MEKTLFVADQEAALALAPDNAVSFSDYLNEYPKRNERRLRVINLCDTDRYLGQGYYCSLLAEAREHQILPSIKTINSLRHKADDGIWMDVRLVLSFLGPAIYLAYL